MEPIINPMWIYLINLGEGLKPFLMILGIILIVGSIILISIVADSGSNDPSEEEEKEFEKFFKKCVRTIIIGIISILLFILIPSKETCYQMIALNMVTPNNIETVGKSVEDFADYIFDNIDKLLEEGTADEDKEGD